MNQTVKCPVCDEAGCSKATSTKTDRHGHARAYECPRCGYFILTDFLNLSDFIEDGKSAGLSPRQRAILSHRLRRQQRDVGVPPAVDKDKLPQVDDPLPTPAEQADNLILWIGDRRLPPPEYVRISVPEVSAWIGAAITLTNKHDDALTWLLNQESVKSLVEIGPLGRYKFLRLTMVGWQRYEALKHAQVESRTAFMAMKFGDEELNRVVKDCFKPAVEATDFNLRVLTDSQPAGLIDDQLRVALRTARFVIADLTHGNNGAYWEAGYAEGLGRPVIYTCRKKEWDERDLPSEQKVHFDTNHHLTVIWDPDKLVEAATQLKATIRNTLPAEAKMTD
ncbi:hypothetical protein QEV83_18740 [Methylocapsa sp. D3K7]|uniref:hypothetical protein n=1 Tax=Methylocapsa sp. D3K7 TaxID=3041435 RepID=UPI00244EEA59|nr:hypothetical protein [Methylocapsa sp. D3K7]WGJ14627.1 hypothetical protein QEV83_18740 [Methylocapsa sp. D3K7]